MKKSVVLAFVALLSVACLTGCNGPHPMAWSPDGSKMAIVASDGLRFGDASGQLSAPVLRDVSALAWLPDSRHLLVAGTTNITTWQAAQGYLTKDEQAQCAEVAKRLKVDLLSKKLKALDEDKELKDVPDRIAQGALLCLRDTEGKPYERQLSAEAKALLGMARIEQHIVRNVDASAVSADSGVELWRGFDSVENLVLSPDGRNVLLVRSPQEGTEVFAVEVLPTKPNSVPVKVAESAVNHVAWTPDSHSIVFVASDDRKRTDDPRLGVLEVLKIYGEDGLPLKAAEAPQKLVWLFVDSRTLLSCLKDGTILFTGSDNQVPSTEADLSHIDTLFAVKPGDRFSKRLLSRADAEQLGQISNLSVSPDDKTAAICQSDKLILVDLASGKATQLSMNSDTIPSWRNGTEVSFASRVQDKSANGHDYEVVLHSILNGSDRAISAAWPKSAVDEFLIEKKDDSKMVLRQSRK